MPLKIRGRGRIGPRGEPLSFSFGTFYSVHCEENERDCAFNAEWRAEEVDTQPSACETDLRGEFKGQI